ncbi:MAG: hypothetical protein ACFFAZ_05135 [Promethearchaeota archaeon]
MDSLADEKGLGRLAKRIGDEYAELRKELSIWKTLGKSGYPRRNKQRRRAFTSR